MIEGLDEAAQVEGVEIFHAGTRRDGDGKILANGGRVLDVSALGADGARGAGARLRRPSTASTGRRASAAATSAGGRWSGRNKLLSVASQSIGATRRPSRPSVAIQQSGYVHGAYADARLPGMTTVYCRSTHAPRPAALRRRAVERRNRRIPAAAAAALHLRGAGRGHHRRPPEGRRGLAGRARGHRAAGAGGRLPAGAGSLRAATRARPSPPRPA